MQWKICIDSHYKVSPTLSQPVSMIMSPLSQEILQPSFIQTNLQSRICPQKIATRQRFNKRYRR